MLGLVARRASSSAGARTYLPCPLLPSMDSWSCTLEVTTPMALAGANPQRAELRPNTFKNMMRWWWRAGRGRLDRAREARLFGDLGRKNAKGNSVKGNACPFRPRLYPCNELARSSVSYKQFKRVNGFLDDDDNDRLAGLAYLGFSLDPWSGKPRGVIEPGARFQFKILPPFGFGRRELRELWASIWLLVWFGGLGARNRRGFGSMRVMDADETGELNLVSDAERVSELRSFLADNLRIARGWLGASDAAQEVPLPKYTAIVPEWAKIYVVQSRKQHWTTALDESGQHLMGFRKKRNMRDALSSYQQVKDLLETGLEPDSVDRGGFGLPIIFYYRSVEREMRQRYRQRSDREARKLAKAHVAGENHDRRASPLFVKACHFGEDWFARVYLTAKARFLEKGENIEVKSKQEQASVPPPNFGILDDYVNSFSQEDLLEVPL